MNATTARLIAGAGLLATWVYLVATGRAPAPELAQFVSYGLVGLIGHASNQGGGKS
jgi:xanthosine utilization system XapX-like protein